MQLDIFDDSRDVVLRNAVIDALGARDVGAAARAIGDLVAEYPGDASLPEFNLLYARIGLPVAAQLDRAEAAEILRATEGVVGTAQRIFGSAADAWLAPFWAELARAAGGLAFDSRDEMVHTAPLLLRAGQWADARSSIESIPSWRRQPAPLAWMIEASARTNGLDLLWPMLAELAWMAPRRAQQLAERLQLAELSKLVRGFHVEFDDEGSAQDFAWFPAWVLIVHPQLAERLRDAQAGADTAPERCARVLLNLLALERLGRHAQLVEVRKKLRDSHRGLFDLYMRSRAASVGS